MSESAVDAAGRDAARQEGSGAKIDCKIDWREFLLNYNIILVLLLLCVGLSLYTDRFLNQENIINITRQVSINGILAIGMTVVVLTGGIDLSVGSLVALSGVVTAVGLRDYHMGLALVIPLSLLVGLFMGSINGYFVAYCRAAPFVVTLAMMTAARGLTYVYSKGRPISPLPAEFLFIGKGNLWIIPIPVIIFLLTFLLGYLLLSYFRIGRYIYAVGGNETAAIVSGINAKRVKLFAYAFSGLLCGLAAVILTARVSAGLPQAGSSYELDAIAATVIGGTSLSGGRGRLWGTLVGALILGVVNNGLDLMEITSFYQQIVKGVIILGAVLLDSKRHGSS
ncbi:MAG: ABC transporter permease [Deltaproteobacteria bacterium]|jgi:ribose/xylose/arabinose/galactoside ABC-type transport system permease subunit|nr:ABC transporter permease [Deltaproteobacteria bacterium]